VSLFFITPKRLPALSSRVSPMYSLAPRLPKRGLADARDLILWDCSMCVPLYPFFLPRASVFLTGNGESTEGGVWKTEYGGWKRTEDGGWSMPSMPTGPRHITRFFLFCWSYGSHSYTASRLRRICRHTMYFRVLRISSFIIFHHSDIHGLIPSKQQ
jgi:hypothetical protein